MDFVRAADYAPLTSPTYSPVMVVGDAAVGVRRCEIVPPPPERIGARPGHILALSPDGPVVSCGEVEAVCIAAAEHDGQPLSHEGWRRLIEG